jgi:magnesium chelatase family protein
MDRIDLVVDVARIDPSLLLTPAASAGSSAMRGLVLEARERASCRALGPTSLLTGSLLLQACHLDRPARRTLETAARMKCLSGRGVTRLLRVARTVADLEGSARVSSDHIAEMLGYRSKEET